jgi:hypothetical protein
VSYRQRQRCGRQEFVLSFVLQSCLDMVRDQWHTEAILWLFEQEMCRYTPNACILFVNF